MIKSFRHKGLAAFFDTGNAAGIQPKQAARIRRMLDMLGMAESPEELNIPGYGLHLLKGERKGEWSMKVSGSWRITFCFEGKDAAQVDLEDYH